MSVLQNFAVEVVACNGEHVMVPLYKLLRAVESQKSPGAIEWIQDVCARHYGVSRREMRSARRGGNIVRPRHIAMYLARELTEYSLPAIGRAFGGRDHTTVLHAIRKIQSLSNADASIRAEIALLRAMIAAGETT